MTISAAATATPIPKPNSVFPFIDPKTGLLSEHGNQLLSAWYNFILGMNRVTPCNATGTNVITLTPLDAAPLIEKYTDFEIYGFTAANTTSGTVTATVVPKKGTLATLKVYKTDGAAQATTNDIVSGSFYWLVYVDSLDGGAGGFVLK
jgi:phage terminase large subunit-like protein